MNCGTFTEVSESIKISTSGGAEDFRRVVGGDKKFVPCGSALIKLIPTISPRDEQLILDVLNRSVGMAAKTFKDCASPPVAFCMQKNPFFFLYLFF